MTTLRRRWFAIYADALDVAGDLLRIVSYSTPDARTWNMTMQGDCGTVTRLFKRTSNTSSDDVRELCERAWAKWVADTLAPGRERGEDWTEAPAPAERTVVDHKRDHRLPKAAARRTRVIA